MSNEQNDLGPKKGETADQFKARISEKERELKRQEAAATPPAAPAPAAPAAPQAQAQVSAPQPMAVSPDPTPAQKFAPVTGNPEVDEWWQKKGFKTSDDFANSYRELERELHRKAEEARRATPPPAPVVPMAPPAGYPPYVTAPVSVPPTPGYGYPPPPAAYAPPTPPVDVEKLARQYGMDPADFERVAQLANDLAESKVEARLKAVMTPLVNQVRNVDRQVSRQGEIVDLMSDPAFRNPQVQFEMHRIMEANPAILETQPAPYRYAYNQALMQIARANLGGSNAAPSGTTPPAGTPAATGRPPMTAGGNGGGGAGAPSGPLPDKVDPQVFAGMSLAEKKAHLQAVGAFGR